MSTSSSQELSWCSTIWTGANISVLLVPTAVPKSRFVHMEALSMCVIPLVAKQSTRMVYQTEKCKEIMG